MKNPNTIFSEMKGCILLIKDACLLLELKLKRYEAIRPKAEEPETSWVDLAGPGSSYVITPGQLKWDGDGLPPPGTECEFLVLRDGDSAWTEGEILYSSLYTVVISGNGFEHVHHPHTVKFRPIRTPEQIEEEKRQQAITEMLSFVKGEVGRDALFDLYEAGYRKQVAP